MPVSNGQAAGGSVIERPDHPSQERYTSDPRQLACQMSVLYMTSASTNPCLGCANAPGNRPTISKPQARHRATARSLVLTTKLNCMARKPRSLATVKECSSIARATPFPCAALAVM